MQQDERKEEEKKKKEKRKIRTDKTFFFGVFLSNIHEVETTVCMRGNASVTKSVVHTWLPRIYAINVVFRFTTKLSIPSYAKNVCNEIFDFNVRAYSS